MIYPDTSFYIALRFANDAHHVAATHYVASHDAEIFLWSPWHRFEVNNAFRQLCAGENPVITPSEARRIIRQLEADVRLGYFSHMESDWRDVLRAGNEISMAHAFKFRCRSADLCHVAYAQELAADLLVSFDEDQIALAQAAGIKALMPKHPRGYTQ